ncbi:MAG: Ig-like domain-containing protein, partial [Moraxella sp.]
LTNDTDPNNNIDPTSVQIVGSTDGKTLVVNGEGTWTVDPVTGSITFKPEASFKGDPTPISYTVKDSTGLVSNKATVTIDYPQQPPLLTSKLAVSEEGLTYGIKDRAGNPTDTTDSADAIGSFGTATSAITTISAPTTVLYSGGEKVIWTSANGVLTGKTETTGVDVIKVTPGAFAAATGAGYTVTLLKAIDHPTGQDENTLDITFGVQTSTEMGQITLTVEDDAPVTHDITKPIQSTFYANVSLVLDLSGSMAYGDKGTNGQSKFLVLKNSVLELLDTYQKRVDAVGTDNSEVRVDISIFADSARHLSLNGTNPSFWVTIAQAKALINSLDAPDNDLIDNGVGFGTNYDAALQEMIKGYQQTNTKPLSGLPGLKNLSYFMTDGDPSFSNDPVNPDNSAYYGIQSTSPSDFVLGGNTDIGKDKWQEFLTTQKIKSYAIGIGGLVKLANITPVSYDGSTATDDDAHLSTAVTDLSQLSSILKETTNSAPSPILFEHIMQSGADANYTASMTVDNITYTYQTSTGKITSDYTHTAWKDLGNGDLQVTTHSGGTVSLHLGQGANLGNMTYQAPSSILNGHTSETI